MKDFIYSEKFDNYLKGKLQKDEKLSFEEELRQDPLLRNEVKWQQEIYHSLSDARRAYLKTRLEQIPIHSGAWYNFTGMQWAAVVSSFLMLAGGSYYYFTQSDNHTEAERSTISIDITVPEKNRQVPFEKIQPAFPLPHFDESAPKDESLTAVSEVTADKSESSGTKSNESNATKKQEFEEEGIPKIMRPDVLSSFNEETLGIDYSDFDVPDKTLLQKPESSVAEVEIETILDNRYSFHYQLFNHKLYLHGDFQGIPYKIIALNQDKGKKLFLEFNGDFYRLRQEQKEITPLEIIKDSTMIHALMKLSR